MYPYGPYAPPYASAPAYAPRPPRTPKAILWSYVALGLYLAFLATAALLAFYLDRLLASLPANPGPAELVGASLPFLAAAVLLILLGLFVVILYFIGFGYLYAGRNEFGPAHARNVRLAMYLLVAALVAFLAGLVISLIGGSVAIRSLPGGSLQVDSGAYYLLVAVGSIVGVVVAAFVAGTLVLSIRALARPKHEIVLYAAAGLGTATPGIAGSLALLGLPRFLAVLQAYLDARGLGSNVTTPPIDPSVGVPGLVGAALGLVTFALYLLVYRDVRRRLKAGELKPVIPPQAPPAPWVQAPGYGSYAVPAGPSYPATPPAPTTPPSPGTQGSAP